MPQNRPGPQQAKPQARKDLDQEKLGELADQRQPGFKNVAERAHRVLDLSQEVFSLVAKLTDVVTGEDVSDITEGKIGEDHGMGTGGLLGDLLGPLGQAVEILEATVNRLRYLINVLGGDA